MRVNLKYQSALMMKCWFPFVVRGSGTKMSMETKSNGPGSGNTCSGRFLI